MTEKIKSKIFNFGNEKESEWPPREGTRGGGSFYWDKEKQKFLEGRPPPRNRKYADAPFIITDSTDPYYHPAACQWTDSKSGIRQLDKATDTITSDKKLPPDPSRQKQAREERLKDIREATRKAVAQIDSGDAPLTEEQRAVCAEQNEIISKRHGIDAFNAVGRKKDKRGKRYKK